jgi:pyruvate,orthophosphate dikinase
MQARAILEAAVIAEREAGRAVQLEIMIPLVAMKGELDFLKNRIDAVAKAVEKEKGARLAYMVGTMIELPRAALKAGEIAETAEFFSFGTNDLTQTTFGLSRDDATKFLPDYVSRALLPNDPFVSLDVEGVGELIRIAARPARTSS